jgi:hypothetical protein
VRQATQDVGRGARGAAGVARRCPRCRALTRRTRCPAAWITAMRGRVRSADDTRLDRIHRRRSQRARSSRRPHTSIAITVRVPMSVHNQDMPPHRNVSQFQFAVLRVLRRRRDGVAVIIDGGGIHAPQSRARKSGAELRPAVKAIKTAEQKQLLSERPDFEKSRSLLCVDGTLSPSCMCHGAHGGCCSHHGCEAYPPKFHAPRFTDPPLFTPARRRASSQAWSSRRWSNSRSSSTR